MIKSVDPFYRKTFDEKNYNCLHFTSEIWLEHTGQNITEMLTSFLEEASTPKRRIVRLFEEITVPEEPCIVVMQRPRVNPHLGVYLRRRVLHITEAGVEFQPVEVASRGFKTIRFFRCRR